MPTYEIQRAHAAHLNLVQCSGAMTYLAKKMEEKYGTPYRRVSFFGDFPLQCRGDLGAEKAFQL